MELLSEEALKRLADWFDSHYPSRKDAADAMLTTESNISNILARRRPFGPKYRKRFEAIGGSIVFILTGTHPNAAAQRKEVEREIEEKKIIDYLRRSGLDSYEKVEKTFSPILKIADTVNDYKTKKKKGE